MSLNGGEFGAYDGDKDDSCVTPSNSDNEGSSSLINQQAQDYGSLQDRQNGQHHSLVTEDEPLPPADQTSVFFDTHRFDLSLCIFSGLCLPSRREDRWGKLRTFSAAVHVVIFGLGGAALFVMSVVGVAEFNRQNTLIAAKVLSALVGVLFMSVFFLWLLVIFTYFTDRCHCLTYNSFIYSIIWAIMFIFSTCLVALLTWETVGQNKSIRLGLYFRKNCTGEHGGHDQCFAFVVVWALASIILYKLFYCIVFVFICHRKF